jgi:hypothetical protein
MQGRITAFALPIAKRPLRSKRTAAGTSIMNVLMGAEIHLRLV